MEAATILLKSEHGGMIGRGERSAVTILKNFWPEDCSCLIQVRLFNIAKVFKYPEKLSERQQKETIDIIYVLEKQKKYLAVRVQDSRHRGEGLARADRHQKDILAYCGILVIDLHEDECPELFKERVNYLSHLEIAQQLKFHKVKV